jgi:hypothetical protein
LQRLLKSINNNNNFKCGSWPYVKVDCFQVPKWPIQKNLIQKNLDQMESDEKLMLGWEKSKSTTPKGGILINLISQ